MIVKPTFIQSFEEEKMMEPVICQWINNPLMLTMHLFHPLLVVQIVNISFNPVQHIYEVEISDGTHSIPATARWILTQTAMWISHLRMWMFTISS